MPSRSSGPWLAVLFAAACSESAGDRDAAAATDDAAGARAPVDAAIAQALMPCAEPLLFGHRGTILFAPENTLPAYEYAIDYGGDGIEVDLQVTADGVLVAMHDRTIGRTTDGGDVAVRSLSLEALSSLDAGAWFAPEFAGTRVPSLDTVLDRFDANGARFLFDIKDEAAVDPLVDAVRERGLIARSIVSSSSLDILRACFVRVPDLAALYYPSSLAALDTIDVPSVRYVRVPKALEDDPVHVRTVRAAGYEAAISGRFVQWDSEDSELTALVLVNNMELTSRRKRDRKPPACAPSPP
jgi:glycerophosphoryl diester phosphodiesterase